MILGEKQPVRKLKIDKSPTLLKYKNDMVEVMQMCTGMERDKLEGAVEYSINKRLHNAPVRIDNDYTKKTANLTLLQLSDWIASREPIITAHGTMFKKHGDVPTPVLDVIQLFLDKRVEDKDKMLSFPKGSEFYEKYNLFQQLDKIDCNG